jgi:two-component system, OmpR family, alkaline phosphatase synthesis response regulator PhoP
MKILIVDDEQRLLDALSIGFQFQWQDAVVLTAHNGDEGLRMFYEHNPDVVLLDVGMPGMSGFEVLQEIRRVSDVPVIMLTAAGDEMDHVHGLELGADDYLVKPFSRIALMAHVKAVLRRAQLPPPAEALPDFAAGNLTMHFQTHQVTLCGEPVPLTPLEYKLLYHLVRNAGRLMPYQALLDRVWGPDSDAMEHHVRVCISKLRAKIEQPGAASSIVTERGLGYRFVRHIEPEPTSSSRPISRH